MVFLQVMGIVFCVLLLIGSVISIVWIVTWMHDLSMSMDMFEGNTADIYGRLSVLESEKIRRGK
jgi:preprotein translocase subunit SecF